MLDSQTFISGSRDKTIKLWNIHNGNALHTFEGHTGLVRALATMDSQTFISGSADKTIKRWNLPQGLLTRNSPSPRFLPGTPSESPPEPEPEPGRLTPLEEHLQLTPRQLLARRNARRNANRPSRANNTTREDLVKIVTIIMNVIQVHVLKIQLIEQRNVKVQEIMKLLEINVLQIDNVK